MAEDRFNPRRALQFTRMLYFAIFASTMAFLVIVFYIAHDPFFFNSDFSDPMILVLLIMFVTLIPGGYLYSKNTIKKIDQNDLFINKYQVYQTGLLIKLSVCEAVALFAAVCLITTNNLFCIIFFFLAAIIMISYYPTPDRIGREINLTQSEIEKFY